MTAGSKPLMAKGWDRPFFTPIDAGRGRVLVTLRDAGEYIDRLPKAKKRLAHWRAAAAALIPVTGCDGDRMLAEIGMRKALAGGQAEARPEPRTRKKAAKRYRIVTGRAE